MKIGHYIETDASGFDDQQLVEIGRKLWKWHVKGPLYCILEGYFHWKYGGELIFTAYSLNGDQEYNSDAREKISVYYDLVGE